MKVMRMRAVADRTLARENGAWRRGWANKDRPRSSGTAASLQQPGEGEEGGGARGAGECYLPTHQTGKDKAEHTFSPAPISLGKQRRESIFFLRITASFSFFPFFMRLGEFL